VVTSYMAYGRYEEQDSVDRSNIYFVHGALPTPSIVLTPYIITWEQISDMI